MFTNISMTGLGVTLLFGISASGVRADDPVDRVLRDGLTAWKSYQQKCARLNGEFRIKMTKDDKPFACHRYQVKQNDQCKFLDFRTDNYGRKAEAATWVHVHNPAYAFSLTKTREDRPWTVVDVAVGPGEARKTISNDRMRSIRNGVDALIRLNAHTDLLELVAYANFKILAVKQVSVNGRELVEVRFDNLHAVKQQPFCPIQKGKVLLDPGLSWCLRGYEVFQLYYPDAVAVTTLEVQLSDAAKGYPIPKRLVERSTTQSATEGWKMRMVTEYDFDVSEPGVFPSDDDFTLSHFGFNEPIAAVWPKRTRWYLWILGFAAIAFVSGWYWRRRQLQRAAISAAAVAPAKTGRKT